MGLYHLLIAALAVGTALAADPCACVNPDQKINPISNPMIFFQQPTEGGKQNGIPCPMNCTLTAHANDEAVDGLSIQILTNNLGKAKINVVDGPRTFVITQNTEQKDITWKSTGGVLVFNFEGEVSPVGVFMLVVQRSETGRDPLPSFIPTTTGVPTPAYDSLKYHNNPLLVANDIMVGIDLSSSNIDILKSFATELVQTLTITNATDCGVGTRLALHGLTNYVGFTPTYFPDWQYMSDNFLGNIAAMTQIGDGKFNIGPVQDFVNSGFKDNVAPMAKGEADRCLNRGRIYILLTTQQPFEFQPDQPNNGPNNGDSIVDFIARGVHPILVTTQKEDKIPYYDQYKTTPATSKPYNRWSYFDINKGVTEFLNNFLVDTTPDVSCQLAQDTKIVLKGATTSALPEKFSIPPYYEGMKKEETDESKWDADWDTIKHYCNFESTTVQITQSGTDKTGKKDVCLRVFYDLETDQDFVKIYSGDLLSGDQKEVVRLTGRDVSGSTFRLGNKVGSIVFSSDEKNVYDGFYAEIYPCGADDS